MGRYGPSTPGTAPAFHGGVPDVAADEATPLSPAHEHDQPFAIVNLSRGTEASVNRSRPIVLVIFIALAACSTRDDSAAVAGLAQDSTLARLGERPAEAEPLPAACSTVSVAATSAVVNDSAAKDLARRAYDAELLGHVQEAQSLLRHATELDGTNQALVYHLGRTSEALGDREGAMTAYCRYLTLASTAPGAADARQRVVKLALSQGSATTNVASSMPPTALHASSVQRVARRRSPAPYRVATTATRASSARSSLPRNDPRSTRAITGAEDDSPGANESTHRTSSDGDVIGVSSEQPTVTPPATTAPARRGGPTRVQGAGIGAVAGAIIGAAAGRNVKSTVIGAAAGGILGTMVAGAAH